LRHPIERLRLKPGGRSPPALFTNIIHTPERGRCRSECYIQAGSYDIHFLTVSVRHSFTVPGASMPPSPMIEETSGWYSSERKAKTRLKALFQRAKSEFLIRQRSAEMPLTPTEPVHDLLPCLHMDILEKHAQITAEINSTWPSGASRGCQDKHCHRHIKAQKSLPNLSRAFSKPATSLLTPQEAALPDVPPLLPSNDVTRNVSTSTMSSYVHMATSVKPKVDQHNAANRSVSTTNTSFSSQTSYSSPGLNSAFSSTGTDSYNSPIYPDFQMLTKEPSRGSHSDIGAPAKTTDKPSRPESRCTVSLEATATQSTKPLPSVPSPVQPIDGNERRVSVVPPLPAPGHIRKTSARYRSTLNEPNTPTSPCSTTISTRSRSSSYQRDSTDVNHRGTVSYSLFPRTPSIRQEPISPKDTPPPSSTPPTTPSDVPSFESKPLSRTRSVKRIGKLLPLSIGGSCFKPLDSPVSFTSTRNDVKPPTPLRLTKAQVGRSLVRQKSMPSLHAWEPPLGPPPKVPLPALPLDLSRWAALPIVPC
jgi:hypothetical protein